MPARGPLDVPRLLRVPEHLRGPERLPAGQQVGCAGGTAVGKKSKVADEILRALGGPSNLIDLEPCITRIRAEVRSAKAVDLKALEDSFYGVVRTGSIFQVIVGPRADDLVADIRKRL
jgi:PTS system N-acetylglucosamine-specific IIB component